MICRLSIAHLLKLETSHQFSDFFINKEFIDTQKKNQFFKKIANQAQRFIGLITGREGVLEGPMTP